MANKVDFVILLSTFFVGIAAGSFIYFNGFRTLDLAPPAERAADWSVEVATYGGCLRGGGCASYRLTADGAYTLLPAGGGAAVARELDTATLQQIDALLLDAPYTLWSTARSGDCDSYFDGLDTTYTITLAETQYVLDTCTTNVDVDDELIETLDGLLE